MIIEIEDGESEKFGLIFNKVKTPVTFRRDGDKLWLYFSYNKPLTDYIKKTFVNCKWHGYETPSVKNWTVSYCEHNMFRIAYMSGMNPYERYDAPIKYIETRHPLKQHQREMAGHWFTRRRCIAAMDPGLGKSLSAISVVEYLYDTGQVSRNDPTFWVATKSALISVQIEYKKWCCNFPVVWMTYDGLKKYVETIECGTKPPKIIIGDESHKLKHAKTRRTQCFDHVTRCMREEHGDDCYIMLMSGTCAPKSPLDWHSQVAIAVPGYLQEGTIFQFKERLAIIKQKESTTSQGSFPELISWRDNTNICGECGKDKDDFGHNPANYEAHAYVPCVNEVENLYKRMKGLVLVKTKKECTDLPDKIYRRIYCKPSDALMRAVKLISKTETSAIKALTRMRTASDGFSYTEIEDGKKTCELCKGSGKYVNYNYVGPEKTKIFITSLISELTKSDACSENQRKANQLELELASCEHVEDVIISPDDFPQYFKDEIGPCPHCDGDGTVPNMIRSYKDTKTAKDQALIDVIEDHDDIGRIVVFGGFKATVDRITEIVKDRKWDYIRLDGRGWESSLEGKPSELVEQFQNLKLDKQICWIGNPASSGTGLTLTASPTIVYYSNDFNAESRMQSEDRIHRMGMDECRGATIIDLIHLPTDEYVLDNLQRKKRLQDMTLGQVTDALDKELERIDYE